MQVKCLYCGQEFEAERSTAQFCSSTHRKAYNRLARKITSLPRIVGQLVDEMVTEAQARPELVPRINQTLAAAAPLMDSARMVVEALAGETAVPPIEGLALIARTAIRSLVILEAYGSDQASAILRELADTIEKMLALPPGGYDRS